MRVGCCGLDLTGVMLILASRPSLAKFFVAKTAAAHRLRGWILNYKGFLDNYSLMGALLQTSALNLTEQRDELDFA